jgi:hypothetical protein
VFSLSLTHTHKHTKHLLSIEKDEIGRYVACMGEKLNPYSVLVKIHEEITEMVYALKGV